VQTGVAAAWRERADLVGLLGDGGPPPELAGKIHPGGAGGGAAVCAGTGQAGDPFAALSTLLPDLLDELARRAPPGADTRSWRY
jgi:hypothetical protein